MKKLTVIALLSLGLASGAFAQEPKGHPSINFVVPSSGSSTVDKNQFVVLVIEPAYISHHGTPIPAESVAEFVNTTMTADHAPYLAVHIREGVRYGEVVNALDALSKTTAKSISVSMNELPIGREI